MKRKTTASTPSATNQHQHQHHF